MNYINPETDANTSQDAKEGREYIVIKDGRGGEHKAINFDWEGHAPKTGIVEVIPLKFAKGYNNAVRHHNEVTFGRNTDKKQGYIIGAPQAFDKDGFITWKRFTLRGAEFLDLSVRAEREKWICIKYGPFLKGSPNFINSSKTVYEAVDKEREANSFKLSRRSRISASEIAGNLVGESLKDMALAIGFDPKSMSEDQLWMEVVKFAENTTKDRITGKTGSDMFLEIYNSETRADLVTLKRAISTGVVTITPALGYSWNGHTLGFTEADATVFIRQNNSIRSTIDALSRKTQTSSTQNHESAKAVINAPSANEERLRRELEDALARLNALTEKNESAAGDNDSELEDLLAEGHRLEIKGIHLIAKNKSLEERKLAIKAKIESVKNQSFS